MKKKPKNRDYDRPPGETPKQRAARKEREQDMWEHRSTDPAYEWLTGQVKARIEDDQ